MEFAFLIAAVLATYVTWVVVVIDKPQVRRIALEPFEGQNLNNRITLHVVHRGVLTRKNEVDNFLQFLPSN
jgi:hypothetical protein